MNKLKFVLGLLILAALVVPGTARGAVLFDQSLTGSSTIVGGAGAYGLGLSTLEEYLAKGDDFMLSSAVGLTVEKVTFYAVDPSGNNISPRRASVVFLQNDTLAGGAGEDINRPENGQIATDSARPTDWAPTGLTSAQILANWFADGGWDADRVTGTYAGGTSNPTWIYKDVAQSDEGAGMVVTDTGLTMGGNIIWECEITLKTPLTLEADTRYWLAFAPSAQGNWLPGDPDNPSVSYQCPVGPTSWGAGGWEGNVSSRLWGSGYDFFFRLEGVPEPATMALLGIGGLAVIMRRKR